MLVWTINNFIGTDYLNAHASTSLIYGYNKSLLTSRISNPFHLSLSIKVVLIGLFSSWLFVSISYFYLTRQVY